MADEKVRKQKEEIVQVLQEKGCRLTRQRELVLDMILTGECTSVKEIYYRVASRDKKIGVATVYRMLKLLEDCGCITRDYHYQVSDPAEKESQGILQLELEDGSRMDISEETGRRLLAQGLRQEGCMDEQKIVRIRPIPGEDLKE
jgi:Fur family ferric uptake transcriptional regulator